MNIEYYKLIIRYSKNHVNKPLGLYLDTPNMTVVGLYCLTTKIVMLPVSIRNVIAI